MKRAKLLRLALSSLLLASVMGMYFQTATAQQFVPIRPFHRFIFSSSQGYGTLLTRNFSEGQNAGLFFRGTLFGGVFDTQQCGTIPLHRWRVQQSGRAYWYYTIGNHFGGPGYYYEGIAAYVLPPGDSRGTPIHIWYSQRFGYTYTSTMDECKPDEYCGFPHIGQTTYSYHGVAWSNINGIAGNNIFWTCPAPPPPPPPPPSCNGDQEQACYANGGDWNSLNCTCTMPPPDPCGYYSAPAQGDSSIAIMPCGPNPY